MSSREIVFGIRPTAQASHRGLFYVGLGVAGFLLLLFRLPPQSWNVPLLEDGPVFIAGAWSNDPFIVFRPYATYLQLPLRTLAELTRIFPLEWAGYVITFTCATVTALLGVAMFRLMGERISSLPLRLAGWLGFVVMPMAVSELVLTLANLQWYLLIAAFWAVVVVTPSRSGRVIQVLVVVASMLNNPLTALLLPIVVVRIVLTRNPREWVLPIGYGVALIAQLLAVVLARLGGAERELRTEILPFGDYATFYASHVALPTLAGARISTKLGGIFPAEALWVGLGVALAIIVYGLIRGRADSRVGILLFAVGSIGFMMILQTAQGGGLSWLLAQPYQYFYESRYMCVAAALLLGAILLSLDSVQARTRWERIAGVIVAIGITVVPAIADYRVLDVRADTPTWSVAVVEAAAACDRGAEVFRPVSAHPFRFTAKFQCDIR